MPGLVPSTLHTAFLTPRPPSYVLRWGIGAAVWAVGEAAGLESGDLGPRSSSSGAAALGETLMSPGLTVPTFEWGPPRPKGLHGAAEGAPGHCRAQCPGGSRNPARAFAVLLTQTQCWGPGPSIGSGQSLAGAQCLLGPVQVRDFRKETAPLSWGQEPAVRSPGLSLPLFQATPSLSLLVPITLASLPW